MSKKPLYKKLNFSVSTSVDKKTHEALIQKANTNGITIAELVRHILVSSIRDSKSEK